MPEYATVSSESYSRFPVQNANKERCLGMGRRTKAHLRLISFGGKWVSRVARSGTCRSGGAAERRRIGERQPKLSGEPFVRLKIATICFLELRMWVPRLWLGKHNLNARNVRKCTLSDDAKISPWRIEHYLRIGAHGCILFLRLKND